jgi:hypothetical protein
MHVPEGGLKWSKPYWASGSVGGSRCESRSGFWHRWDFGLLVCLAGDFGLRGRWTEFSFDGRIQLAGLLLLLLWLAERGIRVSVLLLSWYMDSLCSFKERPRGIPSRLLSCTQIARKTKTKIKSQARSQGLDNRSRKILLVSSSAVAAANTSYIHEGAARSPRNGIQPPIPSLYPINSPPYHNRASDHSSTLSYLLQASIKSNPAAPRHPSPHPSAHP